MVMEMEMGVSVPLVALISIDKMMMMRVIGLIMRTASNHIPAMETAILCE